MVRGAAVSRRNAPFVPSASGGFAPPTSKLDLLSDTRVTPRGWVRLRLVRGIRRCCLGAAAVLAASSLIAPWSGAAEERPDTFSSRAASGAMEIYFNTVPEQVIPEILRVVVAEGDSQWDSNVAKSRASTVYPGLLISQGGSLITTAGGPPVVPPWPLSAYADTQTPDATVETAQKIPAGPMTVDAGKAEAHVGEDKMTADAVNGRIDIAGNASTAAAALDLRRQVAAVLRGPVAAAAVRPAAEDTSLLHVDSTLASTSHTFSGGKLTVTATATANGVCILGCNVKIGAIQSVVTVTTDGERATADRAITISNSTLGGEPVTFDHEGITVGAEGAGQGADGIDQLNKAVEDALGAAGYEIRLLGGSKKVEGATAEANVEGLLVGGPIGAPGNGAVTHLLLGKAGAAVSASPFESSGEVADVLSGDAGAITGGDLGAPSSDAGGVSFGGGSSASADGPGGGAAPDDGGEESGDPVRRAASVFDPTADRMQSLYLSLMLGAIGLALGWRRIIPSTTP